MPHVATVPSRVVYRGGEEDHAGCDDAHTLEDAQRTRIEIESVLQVQRPRHQSCAHQEAERISDAARRQDEQRERCEADGPDDHAVGRVGERWVGAENLEQRFLADQGRGNDEPGNRPGDGGIAHKGGAMVSGRGAQRRNRRRLR